jgi:hypothetical protein
MKTVALHSCWLVLVFGIVATAGTITIGTDDPWNGIGWAAIGNGQVLAEEISLYKAIHADYLLVQAYTTNTIPKDFEVGFSTKIGPDAISLAQKTFQFPVGTPDTLQNFLLPLNVDLGVGSYYFMVYSHTTRYDVGSPLGLVSDLSLGAPIDIFSANNGTVGSINLTSPLNSAFVNQGTHPWGSLTYGNSFRFQISGELITPEPMGVYFISSVLISLFFLRRKLA